ncbi:polymorphic toxin-type HINT domain-containing protein [Streptomyces sp. NBC_00094]|uniref:polymorphic toxin-type HINT domain-containing protein n=1 Tax=Streptomyces sp. NBC_00094 TaxID=2903620 RepID=UPI002259C6D5|nr:polymorphic toxin-type HINT domain-containing protein [Streptomyces sp. NBC_00094]MCX5390546.1 polymorphic toxin-type HINT domain-containing protein [Streptomyces sp. NBC_00094]
MFGRISPARRRARRTVIPALGAALLVGLLPSQSLALPPDPATAETGRESLEEVEPLALEEVETDTPADGVVFEKNLDTLKVDVPADLQQAPAGTTTIPPANTGTVSFGSGLSAALMTETTAEATSPPVQVPNVPVKLGQAVDQPMPTGTWATTVVNRTAEISAVDRALAVGTIVTVEAPVNASVPISVQLDYSKFEILHGADWASRLRLVQFPECYLTTPLEEACQAYEELESTNDPGTNSVTATVDTAADGTMTPALFTGEVPQSGNGVMQASYTTATAAAAGGDKAVIGAVDSGTGPGGSFKATPLASSGSWSAGGSSGAFTWNYPLTLPPAPAGPTPNVTLSYNSQTVDGKTAVSSPQASWIGEGWDYNPGHIERRYRSCKDDTHALTAGTPNNTAKADKTGDLCWVSYNAVMSLGGSTTQLVRDAPANSNAETDVETYRPQRDDGTRVERHTGGTNDDNNGEYWVVTTKDGTKYHFGLNKVGGGHAHTNSVSTVPVFGNHPGEPCHETAFADSRCGTDPDTNKPRQQAWRWGLDKVEDVHGNVMIVNWAQETNHYAVRAKRNTPEQYDRFAYPTSIEYGMRSGDLTKPSAKIEFGAAERCLKSTTACDPANFAKTNDPGAYRAWWDTPGSLNCKSTSKLCPSFPSFWTQKRLDTVTTKAARPGYSEGKVDTYTLHQSFPEDWYDTSPGLWLNSITRTGFSPGDTTGTLQSKDGVSFGHYTVGSGPIVPLRGRLKDKQLPSLVPANAGDKTPGFTRPRIGTIATEAGADIEVEYDGGCAVQPATDKGKANPYCYPVHWSPDGEEKTPPKAWFNKYVVDSVTETDKVASLFADPIITDYHYYGPAWAKSDDEFLRPNLRTYSDWRGNRRVTVTKGNRTSSGTQTQSRSISFYFQGIGGAVKDSIDGTTLAADDAPQYAGMTAETLTFLNYDQSRTYLDNDAATKPAFETRTRSFPDVPVETASRPREAEGGTALTALVAHRTEIKKSESIQSVSDTWRAVRTTTLERDGTYGLPTKVETAVVDPKVTGGETLSEQTCATTEYVHNAASTVWLIGLPKSTRSTATACADQATADPATELKGSVEFTYDNGGTLTKGMPTSVSEIDGTGTSHSVTTTTTYDPLGRIRTVTKPGSGTAGATETTETQYTPGDLGGPVTSVKTINAAKHATTTTYDPGRALPLTVTDPNGRVTRTEYDALGRLIKGWSASRSSGSQTPNVEIAYQTASATPSQNTRPAAVTVKTLKDDGSYARQVTLYDGLMRQVQTQSEAHGPGRVVTDTKYNDHGLVKVQTGGYLAKGEPITELFQVTTPTLVQNSVRTNYDGLGRPVRQTPYHGKNAQAATTTEYLPDASVKVNPAGSTTPTTSTVTDALGRVTQIEYFTGLTPSTATNVRKTTYGYDKRGNRNRVSDPAGNAWTYTYDTRGRLTSSTDPDTGTTTTQYDAADRPKAVTDALGQSTYTAYDVLGRVTAVREGSATATPVKEFTYDKAGALGLLEESKRHTTDGDYINRVTSVDTEYRPTSRQTVIPVNAKTTGLSGTYTYSYTYTPTGKPLSVTLPAKGGLASEKVITRYNEDGLPESTSGLSWYTTDATYSPYGEVLRTVSSAQPYRVWTTNFIDEHTGRLQRTVTDRETAGPHRISDARYAYDTSGMITASARSIAEASGTTWDNQCFTYDAMGELVNAWTSSIAPPALTQTETGGKGCKSASGATWGHRPDGAPSSGPVADALHQAPKDANGQPTAAPAGLSDTAPYTGTVATGTTAYHQSFTFDWLGNRATMTDNTPAGNTSYTYKYSATQPHTLLSAESNTADKSSTYTYNPTGTTNTRDLPGTTPTQTLQWTNEQKLESNTAGTVKTTYVYDADGNRILENSPTGSTLYLGETELTTDSVGLITRASRSYGQAGAPTVVRTTTNGATTGHKLTVLITDHLGTANTSVEVALGQPVTRRAFKPYGESRGTKPADWPNKRSYLGVGIDDKATLLTHIGAREYDQNIGRFISADPIIDFVDPLQMNGYAYANNSPISHSDPTGLFLDDFLDSAKNAVKGAIHGTIDWASETAEGWNILTGDTQEAAKIRNDRENPGPGNPLTITKNLFGEPAPSSRAYHASYWLTQFMMPILPSAGTAVSAAGKGAAKIPSVIKSVTGKISSAFSRGAKSTFTNAKQCFLAGTKVLMANGAEKNIEDIRVGDKVLAADPGTGKSGTHVVTALISTKGIKKLHELSIKTADGVKKLTATAEHPFWVPTVKQWINAEALKAGTVLATADGSLAQVVGNRAYTENVRTYNFTVADLHTYYVLAGSTPVLVHNACGDPMTSGIPTRAPAAVGNGTPVSADYRSNFFAANPGVVESDGYWVHHAVERQALKRYPGLFSVDELNSAENLRGIPSSVNSDLHLSRIRILWNGFYKTHPKGTTSRQDVLDYATFIDDFFGGEFEPRIR